MVVYRLSFYCLSLIRLLLLVAIFLFPQQANNVEASGRLASGVWRLG